MKNKKCRILTMLLILPVLTTGFVCTTAFAYAQNIKGLKEPVVISQDNEITRAYYHKVDGNKEPYEIFGRTYIKIENPNDVICGIYFKTEKTNGLGVDPGFVLPHHTKTYRVLFCGEPEDTQEISIQCRRFNKESDFVNKTIEWDYYDGTNDN